jgi:hypothetical protein
MFLIILLVLAALGLAATAEFFSVIGLATTYAGSFYSVVALGCAIGFGKLVSVSFLYRFWSRLSIGFRAVLTTIIIAMMLITSFGTFGFLTKANQTDMIALKQTGASQALLEAESARLSARKVQIDQQVAQLKPDDVQGRVRLNRQFKDELKEINTRLPLIEKEKAQLATNEIKQQSDVGPLIYLAKSLHLDVDIATTWFTLLLVIVLDPAAVILTLCTNIAIAHRQHKSATINEAGSEEEVVLPEGTEAPRSINPAVGSIRFNEETEVFERYDGGQWFVYMPHDDNEPPAGLAVTGTIAATSAPITSWTTTTTVTEPATEEPVIEEPEDTSSPALDHTIAGLSSMNWVPEPAPIEVAEPVVFPTIAEVLTQQPVDTQMALDFNAPLPIVVEEQPPSGTLTDPHVARMAFDAVFKDVPEYFNPTPTKEENANELLEEVAIAQGPQPVVDNTGIEPNTFGQANKAAWDNFVGVSNSIANNREVKNQEEFKTHLAQLQAYVDELDTRVDQISEDEAALRSRILAFIQRHQPLLSV